MSWLSALILALLIGMAFYLLFAWLVIEVLQRNRRAYYPPPQPLPPPLLGDDDPSRPH